MKRQDMKKVKKQKKKSKWFIFFKILFLSIVSVCLVGLIALSLMVMKYKPMIEELWDNANQKVASINEGTFKDKTETIIYDNKGKVITEVAVNDYYYIEYDQIKEDIKDAVIAIEDVRYLEHDGFDIKGMGRAFVDIVGNEGQITQGGSTITQQLVKLQFLSLEKSYTRKIEEILIASKLETKYSKEQILEFYLNNINYGNGAYGIETASKTYFNKSSNELSISEVAFLTAIPNNPSVYNPVKNMDNTLKRRDIILSKMKEYGFITNAEHDEAKSQVITLNMPKKEYKPETYEVSFALSSATKLIMEKEGFQFKYWFNDDKEKKTYNEEYSEMFTEINQRIRNGGYEIYTTIDMTMQAQLQDSINKKLSGNKSKDKETGLYKLQGSGAVIDNNTGDLVAIIGGRTQEDIANTYNRAFLSYRQPGSTIKPLVVYTQAFERDILASSVMTDKLVKDGPNNATNRFYGKVTIRKAIEQSYNTIPFQLINRYGADEMIPYLEDMEFSGLVAEDENPIISIGGFTYGTNVYEMAGGYATLANNGQYIKPTGISKIVDITKEVLYENKHKKKQVFDSGSAYLMTDTLKGVMTKGTAKGYELDDMTSVGKTGTTNEYKDVWMSGYTPYYTSVIWVGEDIPKRLNDTTYAMEIWKDFMDKAHAGLKDKDFKMPKEISHMYVNSKTGEVDKDDNHGWWKLELVPEIYWENQERKKEEQRIKAEKDRKEKEKQRLEKIEEILKEAGITAEEEEKRESNANAQLNLLETAHIYSEHDYEFVYNLINDVNIAIEQVILEEPQKAYYKRYYKEVNRIEKERDILENPVVPIEEPTVEMPVEQEKPPKVETPVVNKEVPVKNPTLTPPPTEDDSSVEEPDEEVGEEVGEETIETPVETPVENPTDETENPSNPLTNSNQ